MWPPNLTDLATLPGMTKRATGVVTAADVIAGHVSLDISCLDRLYLTGFVPKLQTPGGVIYFLHNHLGNPITSPAIFEQIGNKFRAAIRGWAQVNDIPMIRFSAGDRKADVMAPYLATARDAGCSQVVAVGLAQEYAQVWTDSAAEFVSGGEGEVEALEVAGSFWS